PQTRLRYAIEEVPDRADGGIVAIDHVECDQPRHHGRGDENIDVEPDQGMDEPEKGIHGMHRAEPTDDALLASRSKLDSGLAALTSPRVRGSRRGPRGAWPSAP